MILTVTPNPSVDRTVFVDALPRGAVIRSRRSHSEPSGKGVNVSLALRRQAVPTVAVLPLGGSVGAQLSQMLHEAGLDTREVAIRGEIRSNVSLVEPDGVVTKINEAGPELGADELRALVDLVAENLGGAQWLACCGSLPPGAPVDLYAELADRAHRAGVRVAVDTSGEPLAAALSARPDLVKPNAHELAELVGRPLRTYGDVVDAAAEIRDKGVTAVLASLGADGAILVDARGATHASCAVETVVSTVGAGDATLAGFLAGGADRDTRLATALRWGAAAVQHEGTLFHHEGATATPATITADLDRAHPLTE
jgi:1-phosphofructokinase